jgi:uncharacterized protein YoaH (UPF0181 family)
LSFKEKKRRKLNMIFDMTGDLSVLANQAPEAVAGYFRNMVYEVDKTFGEGYSAKNPALIASLVQTCSIDFFTAVFCGTVGGLGDAVEKLGDAVTEGLSGESSFGGVSVGEALQSVAEALGEKEESEKE